MKTLSLYVVLFVTAMTLSSGLYAQVDNSSNPNNVSQFTDSYSSLGQQKQFIKNIPLSDIIGSPYLEEGFKAGIIKDIRLDNSKDAYMRYDIYNDAIQVRFSNQPDAEIFAVLENEDIIVKIGEKEFHYKTYQNEDDETNTGFLELFHKGKNVTVYRHYFQDLRMPKKARTTLEQDVPAKFNNYADFYLLENGQINEFDLKKRDIEDLFSKYNPEVEKFIKDKRLKFRSDEVEDLKALLNFIEK